MERHFSWHGAAEFATLALQTGASSTRKDTEAVPGGAQRRTGRQRSDRYKQPVVARTVSELLAHARTHTHTHTHTHKSPTVDCHFKSDRHPKSSCAPRLCI